jgi:hypothetical protein
MADHRNRAARSNDGPSVVPKGRVSRSSVVARSDKHVPPRRLVLPQGSALGAVTLATDRPAPGDDVSLTRACPGCLRCALVPVFGGRGRMGNCPRCGWTGALRIEHEQPTIEPEQLEPCDVEPKLDPHAVEIVERVKAKMTGGNDAN